MPVDCPNQWEPTSQEKKSKAKPASAKHVAWPTPVKCVDLVRKKGAYLQLVWKKSVKTWKKELFGTPYNEKSQTGERESTQGPTSEGSKFCL